MKRDRLRQAGYEYDHDREDAFSGQDYFPDGMRAGAVSTVPTGRGHEAEIARRLDSWAALRDSRRP